MPAHIHAENEWLASLKPGDEVATPRRLGHRAAILLVDKVTPTQIVCGLQRYRKDNGRVIGSESWSAHSIKPVTPELRQEVETQSLIADFSRRIWERVPLAKLRAIAAILSEPQP